MTVIFPKWTNNLPLIAAVGAIGGLAVVIFVVSYYFSPRFTDVGYAPVQPVPYSHKLHAGLLGFDCRYCHSTVEEAAYAAIPSTETCLNCHKQVKAKSPKLKLVQESGSTGKAIPWQKVHLLPDYVYFNHSIHVNSGVGCASCHGRIDRMEVVRQVEPLSMSWCIDCHLAPEQHLRPLGQVTNMDFVPDPAEGQRLKEERGINPPMHCSACHR